MQFLATMVLVAIVVLIALAFIFKFLFWPIVGLFALYILWAKFWPEKKRKD